MPNEISQLQINGTTYNIADATARDSVSHLGLWRDPDGSNVIVSSYNASSDCYDKGIFNGGIIHHYQTSTNNEDEDFSTGIDFGYPGQGLEDVNPALFSASTGVYHQTASLTLPNAGVGLFYVNGYVGSATGKTTNGMLNTSSEAPSASSSAGQATGGQGDMGNSTNYHPGTVTVKVLPTSSKTYYLWGRQASGANKDMRGLLRACQIY